jgi:hypothetical protein
MAGWNIEGERDVGLDSIQRQVGVGAGQPRVAEFREFPVQRGGHCLGGGDVTRSDLKFELVVRRESADGPKREWHIKLPAAASGASGCGRKAAAATPSVKPRVGMSAALATCEISAATTMPAALQASLKTGLSSPTRPLAASASIPREALQLCPTREPAAISSSQNWREAALFESECGATAT